MIGGRFSRGFYQKCCRKIRLVFLTPFKEAQMEPDEVWCFPNWRAMMESHISYFLPPAPPSRSSTISQIIVFWQVLQHRHLITHPPCCQTDRKLPTFVAKLTKFEEEKSCPHRKYNVIRKTIWRNFFVASMQFEIFLFLILVTEVRCVRLECGQFPTMKIHLIYDFRYQLPNLFLWFMI